jgi:hypothetical protein
LAAYGEDEGESRRSQIVTKPVFSGYEQLAEILSGGRQVTDDRRIAVVPGALSAALRRFEECWMNVDGRVAWTLSSIEQSQMTPSHV